MGELFRSFEESWRHFLARTEPLECFFGEFPEEPRDALLLGWLIPLAPTLRPAARRAQAGLSSLPSLRLLPDHFLHLWVAGVAFPADEDAASAELARGREALASAPAFTVRYPRLNCFHTAVVAEAESEGPAAVLELLHPERDRGTFLPHVTLAVVERPAPPGPLREALVPLRELALGEQEVAELTLCLVPAARTTVLEPWTVVGAAPLGG